LSRADDDSPSIVHTGSLTTSTSTASTPSICSTASVGIWLMVTTDGHHPMVSTMEISTCAVDCHVLDEPHVDDRDAALRTAGVVATVEASLTASRVTITPPDPLNEQPARSGLPRVERNAATFGRPAVRASPAPR